MDAQPGRDRSHHGPHFYHGLCFCPHHCTCLFLCRLTGNEPLTILPLTSEMEEAAVKAHYKVCDRLKLEKKQRRMCRRDPGVAETLMEAISMSALECQYQFRFERWNCTLEGRYRASLLKRGERTGEPRSGVLARPAPIGFPGTLRSSHPGASFVSGGSPCPQRSKKSS